jgi:hypothetical protein
MTSGLKGAAIAGAVVSMMIGGTALAGKKAAGKTMCVGANACKGKGACKGGSNECKGKNDCKGKGMASLDTKHDCEVVGGTVAEASKPASK